MKTRIVQLEIESCDDCPNCFFNGACSLIPDKNRQPKKIKDLRSIPKWCPLPVKS